ncbi:MAG: A/G-specific adenine glycosylase [Lachnospiraceae bacterium]|nr:A/G-specific adenine glycosylase [Lachnospiraceae bacterium]
MKSIPSALLRWYDKERRILPWREDPTPYHVWISEIMLQQTRVESVKAYYERFTARLKDITALAQCGEDELLKLWEGLGYYSRARNLQKAARIILTEYEGRLPSDYEELLKLPGIGAYTAGAIASIAYGQAVAAVDGNVLRVLARYLADDRDIADEKLKRERKSQIEEILPKGKAGEFNQAMMDLGAMICLPKGAKCKECPLRKNCRALKEDRVSELPKKKAAKERRIQERTLFVIRYREQICIRRRPKSGLLAGLWELPAVDVQLGKKAALEAVRELGFEPVSIERLPDSKHIFSHLEWRMRAYLVRADELTAEPKGAVLVSPEKIDEEYALPSAFAAYGTYIRRKKHEDQ